MTAMAAALFARHPGRRASHWRTIIRAVTFATAAAIAVTFLAAAHDEQLPRTQPVCVHWHSCACRYPGRGGRWPGHNQLCAVNWGRPQAGGKEQR